MTRYHATANGRIAFTPEEEAEWDAREAAEAMRYKGPNSVSMRQARLALSAAGLLAQVSTNMSSASEADQIEWEYATTVERNSPLVANMATALGLTEAQVDELFIQASAL